MRRVTVHSKRRVFDAFFKIDEAEVSFELFDGTMSQPVKRLNFERGDSVAAIVYNRDSGMVVLVEQFEYPTYDKGPGWIVETVAGMAEPGETPESALRREVLEELGYGIEELEHIATFYVSPGGSSERVVLYYAEVSDKGRSGPGGGLASEGEDVRAVELSPTDLGRLITQGEIHDAKTLIAAQWLRQRLA